MITSIAKLENFGIFEDYSKPAALDDFTQYNLIYGWNGSGKSTISKVFECIAKGLIIEDFPRGALSVNTSSGSITNHNIASKPLDLCVFNSNFIRENINWDSIVKSILLISEDKIEEKKQLKEKQSELKDTDTELKKTSEMQRNLSETNQTILSTIAKSIKNRFQILDSSDSYFVSYNRAKVQAKINTHSNELKAGTYLLSTAAFESNQKATSPKFKPAITHSTNRLNSISHLKTSKQLNTLFKETITATKISHLLENARIQNWIELGLQIHEGSNKCEFCEGNLSTERLEALNNHFNEAFKIFKRRLESAHHMIDLMIIPPTKQVSQIDLYEEYYSELPTLEKELEHINTTINERLTKWKIALDEKIHNPFINTGSAVPLPSSLFHDHDEICNQIENIISLHNKKAQHFQEQISSAKSSLELHFLTEELNDSDFIKNQKSYDSHTQPIIDLGIKIRDISSEITELEKKLNNESIGADEFNKLLHKFLGRNQISLKFDTIQKGYQILRHPENSQAKNLSEGEKNAIGLIYFLTKLSENDRDISKSIVVFDDPVSSFDSNNLFNAHSFLRTHCQTAQQLFILTHSFNYFKLARDWLAGKNNKKDENKNPIIRSRFYNIEASLADRRRSTINIAPKSLTGFNSEYHFLYATLKQYVDQETLALEAAFAVANMSRKLLEAFLTFKYPHGRGDFRGLMDQAITDEVTCERIYRFINKYSHNQIIEFDDSAADNIASESEYIVRDIFKEIERLDKTHYEGMAKALA
ncbi:AAA family ATPase [Pseudomonas paralactis]|uniref:AAA family ATPase n=1 Tax=Pseudomonas paralactis TaxID=1615673 RepID=UPI001644630A|nr:AAA family ATPase [Pseudomonas paralactis]MBC3258031.1 AAA family ATPase [Pseudomonas paralactis]